MKGYTKSPDMIKRRVKPIPCYLWKYGCEYISNPLALPKRDVCLYTLLPSSKKCTISRRGVFVHNNYYYNVGDSYLRDQQIIAGDTPEKFPAKYDPRDMGHIYYLTPDKELKTATLDAANINLRPLFGMSYKHYMELRKQESEMDAEGREMNTGTRIANRASNTAVIKEAAKRNPGTKRFKNMRAYRKEEKNRIQTEQSVAAKFGFSEEVYGIEPVKEPEKESRSIGLPDDLIVDPDDPDEVNEAKYDEMIRRLVKLGTPFSR